MIDDATIWQAGTLALVVAVFDRVERRRPARAVNRRRTLRLDLLAIGIVIVFGELWKRLLTSGSDASGLTTVGDLLSVVQAMPSVPKVVIGLLLADLCLYWVHRAMHASNLLWRTHVFHHSIEDLYWLSGARTSVTHLFLFAVPQVLLSHVVLALSPIEAAVAFSLGVAVNIWVHVNVAVDLGPLRHFIVTPDYHRVHHARGDLSRKNLGFVLTLWDRLFGTYVDPRSVPRDFPLGLVRPDEEPMGRMIAGV